MFPFHRNEKISAISTIFREIFAVILFTISYGKIVKFSHLNCFFISTSHSRVVLIPRLALKNNFNEFSYVMRIFSAFYLKIGFYVDHVHKIEGLKVVCHQDYIVKAEQSVLLKELLPAFSLWKLI